MKSTSRIRTVLLGMAALALLATVGGRTASAAAHTTNDLGEQVRHKLVMLPFYGVFDNLTYFVEGNTVTLEGAVVNDVVKYDAQNALKGLEGVARINNNIRVLPLSSFDNQIRRSEYRAIFSAPQLSRYSMGALPQIHIIVDGGHVTLEGVVSNQMDATVANLRANSVSGVFSVTNHLRVG